VLIWLKEWADFDLPGANGRSLGSLPRQLGQILEQGIRAGQFDRDRAG
tara:strand:+ start:2947 stop:3090 length:144 start_codon:yes stop_codon:yes gene_type:complete